MGKYSIGVNGAFSGKIGSAIGSNWRNVDYMRGLAKRRKRGTSDLQLAQQMRFALCANQLRVIKDLLNVGFSDKKLNKITGYNAAVRFFLNEAITGEYPTFGVDYSKMRISRGSLDKLTELNMTIDTSISIVWKPEFNVFSAFADDTLFFLLYNENMKSYRLFDEAKRQDGTISISFGSSPGDVVHVWVFGIKRDGVAVSDSQYVGTVTVPI